MRLSGWVHRKRDHGGVLFVDLRDHYGITQIVTDVADSEPFAALERLRVESVVTIDRQGRLAAAPTRSTRTCRPAQIEVHRRRGRSSSRPPQELPLPVSGEADYPEDIRLRYRYLDLRRERLHANIVLRSQVIASIRRRMIEQGFTEFQTPILTASSPEGARDYLVPSRVHPGQILRASAGAADVQAADHGRRLRPLFPDRALLPRRGRPRRPLARRILPARFRNELRHARRCFRSDRAGARRRVRGIRQRQERDARPASSRAFPIARRCSNTAPTSPICATRS